MSNLLQQTLSPSLLERRNFFLNTPITSGRKGELTNNLDAYGAAGLDKDRIEVKAGIVVNKLLWHNQWTFGSGQKGSKKYRLEMSKNLVIDYGLDRWRNKLGDNSISLEEIKHTYKLFYTKDKLI